MKKRKNAINPVTAFDYLNTVLMVVLCLICLYPMLYVAFSSISNPTRLANFRGILVWPLGFCLEGYRLVFQNPNILSGYGNTIIYLIFGTLTAVTMTTLAAFVCSRTKWMWCRGMTLMIVIHMFFGGGIIPFYMLIRELGWIDSRLALIVPGALAVTNMIILRTAIQGIPDALEESARIDGANDLQILVRVILPLISAAIAVQVLFYAVGHWNAWFNATIFLRTRKLYPLQVILREILINDDMQSLQGVGLSGGADASNLRILTQYCTIIVGTVPILCIYPFLQKYFVKGMLIGAVKG